MVRTLCLLVALFSVNVFAKDCVPADQKVIRERQEALNAALSKALAQKQWTKLTLMRDPGRDAEPGTRVSTDAGDAPSYLVVGKLDLYQASQAMFVQDAAGNVFPVWPDPKVVPTRVVTFCGCAPPTHGGAAPPSFNYAVQVTGKAKLSASHLTELRYTAKTVEIRYSQTQNCPMPP